MFEGEEIIVQQSVPSAAVHRLYNDPEADRLYAELQTLGRQRSEALAMLDCQAAKADILAMIDEQSEQMARALDARLDAIGARPRMIGFGSIRNPELPDDPEVRRLLAALDRGEDVGAALDARLAELRAGRSG